MRGFRIRCKNLNQIDLDAGHYNIKIIMDEGMYLYNINCLNDIFHQQCSITAISLIIDAETASTVFDIYTYTLIW